MSVLQVNRSKEEEKKETQTNVNGGRGDKSRAVLIKLGLWKLKVQFSQGYYTSLCVLAFLTLCDQFDHFEDPMFLSGSEALFP